MYVDVTTALRSGVVTALCEIGSVRYMLTDFKLAAFDAIKLAFSEVTVKGLIFHFRKAIFRKLK